jgi:HEAT repeat protein
MTRYSDLQHPDKNVRLDAAMAFGTGAVPSAVGPLVASLATEPDFFVRETIVWALVRIGTPSVDAVGALLLHADAAVRTQAAHALSKLGDTRAAPMLRHALSDTSTAVVQKAAYSLGVLKDVKAIPALVALLEHESPELRNAVRDALTALGEAVVSPLTDVISGTASSTLARVAAVEALGDTGGELIFAPLQLALSDTAWEVRFAAVQALRMQDDLRVLSMLQLATADAHPHVRLLASRVERARR